ncbi:Sister chromatid cohesion protein 2 [Coniothyrium glycines]
MAGQQNGDWHNANGVGLPYRPPPTVDEALPYSPFTSIIPFSPDIIPFPSAEPPTPSSTLTVDQQSAAKKAVGILNSEITGQSTAQHLQATLNHLRELLDPEKLPQYNFKPIMQLATPPESPTTGTNGSKSSVAPELTPFARLLLDKTDVSFTPFETRLFNNLQSSEAPPRQPLSVQEPRTPLKPLSGSHNGNTYTQNANIPPSSSALSSATNSTSDRPRGPAVVIKQSSAHDQQRETYKRYDVVETPGGLSQRKVEEKKHRSDTSDLRPHEREMADRKLEELNSFVQILSDDKDDLDESQHFTVVTTADGDLSVIRSRQMASLSSKMSAVKNLGRFGALPVDLIMTIQSLLQPKVLVCTKVGLFPQEDGSIEVSKSIRRVESALKAAELVLDTMIEGHDDHRMRREEIIDSIVDLIKLMKDACIIPIMRSRKSGSADDLYVAATGLKLELQQALHACGTVLSHFASIIGAYNLSDRALNSLEYLALELFMEQVTETGNVIFDSKKFEIFRQKVMTVLAQIFARHPGQRSSILNGIFSNLDNLPAGKQKTRNFRSRDEKDIMTISALFMRFVQTAATNMDTHAVGDNNPVFASKMQDDGSSSDDEVENSSSRTKQRIKGSIAPDYIAQNLMADATQIAAHIADSLIERVLVDIAKSGDKPIRSLLYLFIEDFCHVLISPQWPSAVTLLYQLLACVLKILHGDQATKHSANNKDMALNCVETIGVGIIKFKRELRSLKRGLDISQSDLSARLYSLVEDGLSNEKDAGINNVDLLAFDGPHRVVLESVIKYLRAPPDDSHVQAVRGYHVTSWLADVIKTFPEESDDARPHAIAEVQQYLQAMMVDPKWLARTHNFQAASDEQCKIATGIISLQSQVCAFLPRLVNVMQSYLRDKSPNLKSKAMSGLTNLIKEDPRVLSDSHIRQMVSALMDASPKLRSNTISLVETCLAQEPSLEQHFLPSILRLTTDPSIAPKKKAIELLKKIYFGPTSKENKLHIAVALLLPSQDLENTVAELSRAVLEEILLASTNSKERTDDSLLKLDRTRRASTIVDFLNLIQGHATRLEAFEKFFVHALSLQAKHPSANLQTCKDLIADLIDAVISPEAGSDASLQARTMNALSVFAKVKSTLFTTDQVQLLKLYIKEISGSEDLALVQPTVVIFRYVLPTLPSLQSAVTIEIRTSLIRNVALLAQYAANGHPTSRETLADVAHCLWTISMMPGMGPDLVTTTIASVLCNLRPLWVRKDEATANRTKIISYLILLGTFGKYCDFDKYIESFRARVAAKANVPISQKRVTEQQMAPILDKNSSASRILLDVIRPFTMQNWDLIIRENALQSMGGICHQSPELFMRGEVEKVIQLVFVNEDSDSLRRIALSFFEEYFALAERRSESGAQIATGSGAVNGSARLETSFVANENDSATLHLAQRFLSSFVETALQHDNEHAVLATKIIASISRQGLVHPKECGAALVALGTSPNFTIARIAADEHKRIHEKQESYLEKEYMQSVHIAFQYQVKVYNDPHGMLETTFTPKLAKLFEALKTGKKVTTKKFVDNLCKQVDFDLPKLDVSDAIPEPLLFARFCLENLALFDFPHLEEVAVFLNGAEGILFKNTGPAVALAIETEIPKRYVAVEQVPDVQAFPEQQQESASTNNDLSSNSIPAVPQLVPPTIGDSRLRQISTACMILQLLWHTRNFVRRCYNLQKLRGRISPKKYPESASRNNLVSGKILWEQFVPIMNSLDSRDDMLKQCWDFANLLEIDPEAKVDDGEETHDIGAGYETPPEGNEATSTPFPTSGRGRKRKSNASLHNTPKKPRGRPAGAKIKKRTSRTPDGDDDTD